MHANSTPQVAAVHLTVTPQLAYAECSSVCSGLFKAELQASAQDDMLLKGGVVVPSLLRS